MQPYRRQGCGGERPYLRGCVLCNIVVLLDNMLKGKRGGGEGERGYRGLMINYVAGLLYGEGGKV